MTERLSEWTRFIDGLEADGAMPAVIVESWQRSLEAGVDREQARFVRVSDDELDERLRGNADWLEIAASHLDWLTRAFRHQRHVVYVADRDGIVLRSAGDAALMETFALSPGWDRSEARMGTNGAGTALVKDRPVAVVGSQHYLKAFGDCTCTGAPIHAPDGSVIGALDISTAADDAGPERLFVVAHAAYAVSRALALKESEARYSSTEERLLVALSASSAGTFRWNPETGRFLDFDDSLKELLGMPPGDLVETTTTFLRRVHPDDRDRVEAGIERCRQGADFEMEFRVELGDGTTRWLFGRARMIRDPRSGSRHLVGACIDITRRKRIEEALTASSRRMAESEGRLATALEVAALGVWEYDPGTGVMRGDGRWAEMVGLPTGASITLEDYAALLHPNDRDVVGELLGGAAANAVSGSFVAEHRLQLPCGMRRWVSVRGREVDTQPASARGYRRYLGTMMDVTEQRQSKALLEAALEREREATALLDAIFTAVPVGMGFWDRELRFQRVNPVLAEMNGLSAEEHLGKRPDELLPDIDGLDEILEQWQRVIETGEPLLNVEVRGQTQAADGGERVWMEDFFPVRIGEHVIGLGAVVEEVTERRKVEEALREADRAKDEFLAVLGHELRNPLAPLRTGLDLLGHLQTNPKLLDSIRPMMERQLSHLVRLVDDLLDISRISRGKIELQRAPLDLNAPVEAAVEQMRSVMAERQHTLELELSADALPVHADFERLTQVVANLLSNAARYTDPGGSVVVSSGREQETAVVCVSDSGYGIPSDGFERLFRLFSQIPEHHEHTGGGGLGIGLALAQQLVHMHGGRIDVESRGLGHGSKFIVRLPISGTRTEAVAEAGAQAARGPGRRVLVVDDNADAAEGLRMLLAVKGHEALAVHDGATALAEISHFAPEVVLLDLGMPGMDGIEVAERIRAAPGGGRVCLVAVTGWGQDEDRLRTQRAGFDGHLTKPIDWFQIEAILTGSRTQP